MQTSNVCCDRPPENTLKSAVDVTDVSANDFRLPSNDPPSSDSGTFGPDSIHSKYQIQLLSDLHWPNREKEHAFSMNVLQFVIKCANIFVFILLVTSCKIHLPTSVLRYGKQD